MLTLFSIPKAFKGHIDIIQRNAIRSWTQLTPSCQIILFGNDEGTAEVAKEYGLEHVPEVENTKFGTPRIDTMFNKAEEMAKNHFISNVNADIILMDDYMRAIEQISAKTDWFMMSGLRSNINLIEPLKFHEPTWEKQLREEVRLNGSLHFRTGVDYFVYPAGLLTEIPPFGVGRTFYDAWLLYRARNRGASLIDVTEVVLAVHQNHDYSHHVDGQAGIFSGPEYEHNRDLAGGRSHILIIKDRTHVLKAKGLRRSLDGWRMWRLLRTSLVLYPAMPLVLRLPVVIVNSTIDAVSKLLLLTGLKQLHKGPNDDSNMSR
jgi:hypothetical protein